MPSNAPSATQIYSATGVLIDGRVLLIEGAPGSGKSTLALALIDRGATLVGDDGVTLSGASGRIHAAAPPNTAGLIEIRNVGLQPLPHGSGPVALMLTLTPDAPRFVDRAERVTLLDQTIPRLRFDPAIPAAAIRAEYALRAYGLAQHRNGD